MAERRSLLSLDQNSYQATASNLRPKSPQDRRQEPQGSYEKGEVVGVRMGGALRSPGNPDAPLLSSFRSRALPFTEPCSRLRGPSPLAPWSAPPGSMNQVQGQEEPRLWSQTVQGWTQLLPFLLTLGMLPHLSGPLGPHL